jgi:Ca2+-binding EF-hand superfamily protein
MRPEARGEHHGPRGGHGFGPRSPEKLIERFDSNKNGQLEAAELPPRMSENIGAIDTNGDAIVSKDELAAHFKAKQAEHQAKFTERAKERFDKKDANHDGMLEQSEVGEHWARLSPADANGDQKLTPEELKAAFEAGKLKMMRGEHGQRWQHGARDGASDAPPAATPE